MDLLGKCPSSSGANSHEWVEDESEVWWERIAHVLAEVLPDTYQRDWMVAANCLAEEHADTNFIRKPDEVTAKRWERICKQCSVQRQCLEWADDNKVTGVYAAGEWRE